jgi:hypothetical protein
MKLNEEENLDIINFIEFFYVDNLQATAGLRKEKSKSLQDKDTKSMKDKLNLLRDLVYEYFDTQPLTFKELKNMLGECVYDSKKKKLTSITLVGTDLLMFKDNDSLFYIIPSYECNNRFYRKEVEK